MDVESYSRKFRFTSNRVLSRFLRPFGFESIEISELQALRDSSRAEFDLRMVSLLQEFASPRQLLSLLKVSQSQLRQDLFVLSVLDFRRDGYFVEFGATDGYSLSNTFLLEKYFGWRGILAEPAGIWHTELEENRECAIDRRAVWSESGTQVLFRETKSPMLSTIKLFVDEDLHRKDRSRGSNYPVLTVSLFDLLVSHSAPEVIDYISIDTEGSELEILSAFDFSQFKFRLVTVEHNFSSARERINKVLEDNGYVRVLAGFSSFEDWFVKEEFFREHWILKFCS